MPAIFRSSSTDAAHPLPLALSCKPSRAVADLPARTRSLLERPTHRAAGRVVRDAVLFLLPGRPAHDTPADSLVAAAADALELLASLQHPSGTFRGGDNVDSPPDTAFTINDLAWARTALQRSGDPVPELSTRLDGLLDTVAPALLHGGVHTPNHRWEIASALARLWEARGDDATRRRAEQWLAEGVDLQADGLFSERSANYAAHVSVPALLAMGRILQRADLISAADVATRRQAELTDARGLVETLASRRQDQFAPFDGGALFPWFRAHAARTGDPVSARAARRTEPRADADAVLTLLALGSEEPSALGPLPPAANGPAPERPEVIDLAESGLVRADHGVSSTVLFGGTDTAHLGRITSGASSQPVLARFRGRELGVRELRLSRDFFSLGPMRPGRPRADQPGTLSVVSEEEVSAEYFHPLAAEDRDPEGRYALEFNGRFAAAMDFSRRPAQVTRLRTTQRADLSPGELTLTWAFDGPETAICLLLALDGLEGQPDLRRDAAGRYVLGPPAATEGPRRSARCVLTGHGEALSVEASGALGGRAFYDPGEAYTFLGATDEPAGPVLLIPASTAAPLKLRLTVSPAP
ncbi:hypothetical protein [Brachybacterium sp. YJGR34]|uniref:hypothetical protein n=1 Tax=Brachybacterium sp. YJGR34 TaxID=2059911 RepID=UPI000E0A1B8D|nr:hypothetical protein [Brachybacterium sp. YJGR34]